MLNKCLNWPVKVNCPRLSYFSSSSPVIAVASIPEQSISINSGQWVLALDGINDPGNLGTIIRIADWYGITTILCSSDTVDTYNPKTIASTMGSFTRTRVHHASLAEMIKFIPTSCLFLRNGGSISFGHQA